jgi:long-chain acyl-CoA synthetase
MSHSNDETVSLAARPSPVTVGSILETSYRRYAHRPALFKGDSVLSYAELGRRVHQLVAAWGSLGGTAGDRIAILSNNCPEFIEVSQAIFVGGYVRVTPSSKLHPREVVTILNDCRPRFLCVDAGWTDHVADPRAQVPSIESVIGLDQASSPGVMPYEELLTSARPEAPTEAPAAWPSPGDLCALLYTSGTTGQPKGAMLTHSNWGAMIRNSMIELPPLGVDEVVLHVAPLSHFSGYVEPTYSARGAAHVVEPSFQPERVLRSIERHRITAMPLVPTMLNMLVDTAEVGHYDLSSLRCIVYGGSGIAPDRLARAIAVFGDIFVQFFGLSETPMPLSALSARDHMFDASAPLPSRLGSAGRVNPFVDLRICDEERRELDPGQVGEIVVRGDVVMAGYWEQPERTDEMIDADGWAATGDLGRVDEDGYLYIVDRKRDMIITGGYNVYPTEVENAIAALPHVQEVAVIGAPDERWGESVVAVVVVRPGFSLDEAAVVGACLERLADYKKPRRIEFVSELPRTGSGKIMRRLIRDRYWAGHARRVG